MQETIVASGWLDGAGGQGGAVALVHDSGTICSVEALPEAPSHALEGWLCPGMINAHCHTELSHLHGKLDEGTGLDAFIRSVGAQRAATPEEIVAASRKAMEMMVNWGVVGLGDICNTVHASTAPTGLPIEVHAFIELFAFLPERAPAVLANGYEKVKAFKSHASLTPHAPYSLSLPLMQGIAEWSLAHGGVLSFHNQESASEDELFRYKRGSMYDRLLSFGFDLSNWDAPGCTSLQYWLPKFPQDTPLILVHNTFTTAEDVAFAQALDTQLYWCLCPRANWFIERRVPPAEMLHKAGVQLLLGTDSLASNYNLNLLEEMIWLQTRFPMISTPELFRWACSNGAEAFGWHHLGRLEAGKRPGIFLLEQTPNLELNAQSRLRPLV
jgi:cytosine/adenosine deaminase-related metal-dependent hydrolase